jgi:phosphatidylserine decarboxylase
MKGDILQTNERSVSILNTKNFGMLAYVEVGALFVGTIVQSHTESTFQRGQEKGYFLFGGSTVIVVGQPGAWRPEDDLLEKTAQGIESFVTLGSKIAHKL